MLARDEVRTASRRVLAEARYGADPACPVRRISPELLDRVDRLESAIVFDVPGDLEAFVEGLRARFDVSAPPAEQLTPHVTVLHLGVQDAAALKRLCPLPATDDTATIQLEDFGAFHDGEGRTNLHLRLTPREGLVALQSRLIGWAATVLRPDRFSKYLGDAFVPHITVWDQARIDAVFYGALRRLLLPADPFALSRLVHIGRLPGEG